MQKVLRLMAFTAVAAVAGFTMAVAPGCSGTPGAKDAGPLLHCTPGTPEEQETNCVCTSKADCGNGNTAKWACTPAKTCVRICTSGADCTAPSVCEDLICRPPACGDDTDNCAAGQACIGGSCKPTVSAAASCAIAPANSVINSGGKKSFWVIAYDASGAALPYKGAVTWGATGITPAPTTTATSVNATFTAGAGAGTGTITASIGSTVCTPSTVYQYAAPTTGVRVTVVAEGPSLTPAVADEGPVAGATVALDDATPQTTDAQGSTTFDVATGAHTISVFAHGFSYVTVVNTTATDLLIPVKAAPHPGEFKGQLKDTDFNNVSNPNGTLHLDITGSSIGGNLIDLSLASLLGPSQPITVSLGTGTPYGPFNLPEGIALGLGAQMFGESGGGHYGAVAAPGYRALWSLGGNAVIGDVLKAIGPVLNGGGGSIGDQIPTILTALLPIIGSLESAVTTGIKVAPDDMKTLSAGGAQPSLKLDTLQRIHLLAKTPHLPSYQKDDGATMATYDGAIVIGGTLASPQGLVPLGLTAGVDQTPLDQQTDAVGTGGAAGKLPLRVAPRHGGLENAPWAFITLGASLKDLVGGFGGAAGDQGIVLSGNVSIYQKGTTTPYTLKYNGGANTEIDLSDDFLGVPNKPTIADRTVTFASDVSGAAFSRLDVGSDADQWAIYYPTGTNSVTIPTPPTGFDDRWTGTPAGGTAPASLPGMNLQTVSLGNAIPGGTAKADYNSMWQFDGVDAADMTLEIDKFSLRAVSR
jgi:hypothetical protein